MWTRREFLQGLVKTIMAQSILKNGVWQPDDVNAEVPQRTIFDMAQNTWRKPKTLNLLATYPYSVVSYTSDNGELCFPKMIGGLVRLVSIDGKGSYVGQVLSMEKMPDGTWKYMVSLYGNVDFSGWRWASTG